MIPVPAVFSNRLLVAIITFVSVYDASTAPLETNQFCFYLQHDYIQHMPECKTKLMWCDFFLLHGDGRF
jgi:hypothetical protein